jgi:hypothetical protein
MEESFIKHLPIKILYSFESLIDDLENSDYNFGEFKVFLDYLKETRPEIIDGVSTFDEFQKLVKDVNPIIEKIIPKPLVKYNLKAITFPFSDKFIFETERLKELLHNKKTNLKLSFDNFDEDTLFKFTCCFILSKYYHVNLDFNFSNQLEIKNEEGYTSYFGTDTNHDYFRIYPSDEKYILTEDQIENLIDNYDDTLLWKNYFPEQSYIAKGFNLISFFDNTVEIAKSNLKSKLISFGEEFESVRNDIVSAMKSIFRTGDLEIGFSAYNSDKDQLEISPLQHVNMSLIIDKKLNLKSNEIACTNYKKVISSSEYYVVSNVEKKLEMHPNDKLLNLVNQQGYQSFILYPLVNGNEYLGILEIASKTPSTFNRINANLLYEIKPLLEESIYRYSIDFENQINAYIQTEYTSLHPSVEWKFRQKAKDHILHITNSKQKSQISFQNIYPIYGEVDVRNSSTIRNLCMKNDYQNQINFLIEVCNELYDRTKKPKFLDDIDTLKDFLDRIDNVDKIYFESELLDFISYKIHPEITKYAKAEDKSALVKYIKKLDTMTGLFYIERKKFDQSIQITNSLLSNKLDLFQQEAQAIFQHYYERFKTDGVDYNLYVGKSITPQKKFSYNLVKEIRFWQIQATILLVQAQKYHQKKMPLKLDVASLIFATNSTIDILFKMDEKRFDVNGYNNAKYEIVKKRLSKAFVKGTEERINQPGKICIIYSEDVLREEYTEYLNRLIDLKFLKKDIEFLEVDDLQGLSGLLAVRVSVNYKNELGKYIKFDN